MSLNDEQVTSLQGATTTITSNDSGVNVYNVVLSVQWRSSCINVAPQNDHADDTQSDITELRSMEADLPQISTYHRDSDSETQEVTEEQSDNGVYIPSLHVFGTDQQSLVDAIKRLFTNLLNTSGDDDFVASLYGAKDKFIIGNVFMETEDHDCIKSLLFQSFILPENEFVRGQFGDVLCDRPSSARAGCVFFNDLLDPSSKHFVEAITTALQSL